MRVKYEASANAAAELKECQATKQQALTAGRDLANAVSTLLLQAHARPAASSIEARAASSSGASLPLQQHETLQRNFQAMAESWRASTVQLETLEHSLDGLLEPFSALRSVLDAGAGSSDRQATDAVAHHHSCRALRKSL